VAFDHRDDVVEVTFAELRDQADGVGLIKTIAMERELFKVEIGEVESDLRDLISEAEQAIRNKDALKARADRLRPREEDDDED
jgi:FtsZ-binding cell division protein ZapB